MSRATRWLLLGLVSLVLAANYYAYDALSSIKALLQSELSLSNQDYGLIVGFYAFPNTFLAMAVIGGIALDRFGIRRAGIFFTACCAAGVALSAWATTPGFREGGFLYEPLSAFLPAYSPELKLMIAGRFLFGVGAETSIVVVNKIVAKWFKGRELAFAFGLNLAMARLGTAAALIASPYLAGSEGGLPVAVWTAAMLMGLGLLVFVIYALYEARVSEQDDRGALEADERFHASDLFDLFKNRAFLVIVGLTTTYYAAMFPFQAFYPDVLHNQFDMPLELAGKLSSTIIFGTILFTPLFGFMVDRFGRRATMMLAGSLLLALAHGVLAFTTWSPFVPMFLLGVAFSLVPAALWPAVPLIVKEKRLGTAYGLMTSIQNFGLFGVPILAGWITDRTNRGRAVGEFEYGPTLALFVGLALVAVALSLWLLMLGRHLEAPSREAAEGR